MFNSVLRALDHIAGPAVEVTGFTCEHNPCLQLRIAGVDLGATFAPQSIHLAIRQPTLEASPHLVKHRDRQDALGPQLAMAWSGIGALPYAGPRTNLRGPVGSDPSPYVEALQNAFSASLGAGARERCALMSAAFDIVLRDRGETYGAWSPRYRKSALMGRSVTPVLERAQMAEAGLDPRRFLKHVRCLLENRLHSIPMLTMYPQSLSGHERLDHLAAAIEGFGRHGIDLEAWLRNLGVNP